MNYCLTKSQFILKSVLAPILIFLAAQIIVAEQRELPAASAQRILKSDRAFSPSHSTSKKSGASPHALTSTPIWISAQNCPVAIARYGFAQVGGNFYVISGLTNGGTVSTGVYRYGPGRTWYTLAPIPVGSEGPVAAYSAYDNKIYVADGYGGQNLLRIYDIAGNTWTSATARPGVTDSFGAAAGADHGQINIAGGNTGGANNILSNYNIPNGVWSTYNNMPTRFYAGGYTQVGRFLYLIGGYGVTSANSNVSMRLDMATITWTTGPTFTPQKADFALAASGSKLFAICGDATGGGFFDPSSSVDELETGAWPAGSWVSSPPDLSPRQGNQAGFFSVARMGGEIWSTGGITSNDSPPPTVTAEHVFRANPCPSIFFVGPVGFYRTTYPGISGTQKGDIAANGVQSACGIAKPFPGILNPTITFPFDQYSFTNNGPAACVTFTIDTTCSGSNELFAIAYLGSYDPTNLAKNYLGDMGNGTPELKTFSVNVPANATVVLVVQQFVSACSQYHVTVTGLNCAEFCNSDGPILIPAGLGSGSTIGPAGPYPSLVSVSGVPGTIASMSVELKDFSHSFSADIDVLLVSPTGQKMILMSDVGLDVGLDSPATIILRDAGIILPNATAIETGLYVPTNYDSTNDTFPGPAPAGPYNDPGPGGTPAGTATLYSSFAGFNPNGNWQLFINDDASGDVGFLNSWCLKFNTIVLQLTNAASRKSHNGTPFDIDLPLTGNPGVECRSAGAGSSHTLVFNFTTNVVSGSATVTGGTGTAGAASFSGNTMTVPLSNVADQQKITVTLNGVTDVSSQVLPATSVSMNVLLGDTTGNKTVNATDVSQVKLQSGIAISAANFRNDTNVNGTINATDVSQVKLNSGHGVP